jgi:hypothetical protein
MSKSVSAFTALAAALLFVLVATGGGNPWYGSTPSSVTVAAPDGNPWHG